MRLDLICKTQRVFRFRMIRRCLLLLTTGMATVLLMRIWLLYQDSVEEVTIIKPKTIRASSRNATCVHPVLNPQDPAIMRYHKPVPPLNCSGATEDWVYVTNGTFRISRAAIRQFGDIKCEYESVVREGDFAIRYAPKVKPMLDGTPLQSDFFRVSCVSAKGKKYTNIHAAVARNSHAIERLQKYHSARKSADSSNKRSSDDADSVSQSFRNLNVFILGFDSLSRMAWQRLLPNTYANFTEGLGGIVLEDYNILGDGTPSALLPILTGKLEEELPSAVRGDPGAKTVDTHPWIWREFSKHGYLTAYAEDMPSIGTFHFRMLGFKDPPTDHFMRPFYLAADQARMKQPYMCWGPIPRHVNFMNWFGSLFDMYADYPKFFFGFHSEVSHDENNLAHVLDDDLVAFLKELDRKGHLNSTLLILMADHGARYDYIRATAQGMFEERLPYFSFRFPPWFRERHPDIIRNMLINTKRLTTPYDIHATLLDILHYSNTTDADLSNRALSLFKEIPKERTCTDADVRPHWCGCLVWQAVKQSDPLVIQATDAAIETINNLTQSEREKCAELSLHEITRSLRYVPSSDEDTGQWKLRKYHGRHANASSLNQIYQVAFKTWPGLGHFEVTCKYHVMSRRFNVNKKEISRINKYGSVPTCIGDSKPLLRPYCYCV